MLWRRAARTHRSALDVEIWGFGGEDACLGLGPRGETGPRFSPPPRFVARFVRDPNRFPKADGTREWSGIYNSPDMIASQSGVPPQAGVRISRGKRGFLVLVGILAAAAVVVGLALGGRLAGPRRPTRPPTIVVLEGTPVELGREHGARLAQPIRDLEDRYLGRLLGGESGRATAVEMASDFRPHLRPHHRAELDTLAEAVGLTPERVLLANCFLDLLPSVGCSTVALPTAAAPDGVARFGRNLDFPGFGIADGRSIVMIVRPAGRHAFAAVTWPGLIGVLSGMNEHGLALANMEVRRQPRMANAMPYPLLYRTVLEECRTVAEAIDLLAREPRQTANNLMLVDAAGDRAVVEIRPAGIAVRRAEADAALVATNHHREDRDEPGRCRRYDCITTDATAAWGRIDRDAVWRILNRVGGDSTLQAMIFEPADRVLHLATGRRAANLAPVRLDLRKQLDPTSR